MLETIFILLLLVVLSFIVTAVMIDRSDKKELLPTLHEKVPDTFADVIEQQTGYEHFLMKIADDVDKQKRIAAKVAEYGVKRSVDYTLKEQKQIETGYIVDAD